MEKLDYYISANRLGDDLLVRGVKDGKLVDTKFFYSPCLYVEHTKDYGFKTIFGQNLKPIPFKTIPEASDFANDHKGSNIKLYGNPNFASQWCFENFPDNATKWDRKDIRVFNIDIEVTSTEGFPEADKANYPVTAICIHDSKIDKFVTFGHGKWKPEDSVLPQEIIERVEYIECKDEYTLMKKFMMYWDVHTPHIVTGWNLEHFDMPYLYNRLEKLGMDPKQFSPWKRVLKRTISTARGEEQVINIVGSAIVDYLAVYRRNKIQDSYRLDNIATIELGEKKLDYSEVTGLHNLYFENFQKFIDYNIQDVNLVKRLDEKLGLINAQIMIAFTSALNIDEVNGTVKVWDTLICNEMFKENKIIPFHVNVTEGDGIPGGHVKDPMKGKHGWCMSFDLNSLYPHLIMQFNISPETIKTGWKLWNFDSEEERLRKLLNKEPLGSVPANHSISAAGHAYTNEFLGIIPRIMKRLYKQRKQYKKEMLRKQAAGEDWNIEYLQQYVMKIVLNSGYGALTNKHFRWNDRRMGESITLSGQYVIQVAEREINLWMNKVLGTDNVDYIIAIDTDSNYVNAQPLVDKFFSDKSREEIVGILDKIASEQIQKVLDQGFEETKEYLNCYEQAMVMEREAIASSAVWTAKKRYAMCVWDMEGVRMPPDKPKIKIQGLEAIRSSTPNVCRPVLLNMVESILLKDEKSIQDMIAAFKEEYLKFNAEDIAFPRTMNNVLKFTQETGFMKGTPPHIRGAVQYNKLLHKHGINKVYEKINNGEKGKFIYLREPNNIGTDVISFLSVLPKEFECEQYLDYIKMFEKTVIDPLNSILEPIGWSAEKKNTLLDFFG